MKVRTRNPRNETAGDTPSKWSRSQFWRQWAAATFVVAAVVAILALTLFAGLTHLRPNWRIAAAPSLALERALPPDQAGRSADDTRVLAR